ncbi:hypothetical protein PUN28_003146 [Cardiocondyla obscurior]|uniref:Uncharacterized protein n=1 Tax=Cardiocondyla obscurior TaxID=286306 RepID=A0AAW2GKE0_9HYME
MRSHLPSAGRDRANSNAGLRAENEWRRARTRRSPSSLGTRLNSSEPFCRSKTRQRKLENITETYVSNCLNTLF